MIKFLAEKDKGPPGHDNWAKPRVPRADVKVQRKFTFFKIKSANKDAKE